LFFLVLKEKIWTIEIYLKKDISRYPMQSKNIIIIFVVVILVIVGSSFYLINNKNNEINELNSNINSLEDEKSKLNQELSDLNKEINTFIEGCKFVKDGCKAVRSIKAEELLSENGIEENYLGFNVKSFGSYTLEFLYNSGDEATKSIIEDECDESYYIPSIEGREERTREPTLVSKESFVYEVETDRDASITSNLWRQKAYMVFNSEYEIVCGWRIDITNQIPSKVYTPLK